MFYFFEVGRNDPCECGSGRKYKRCCKGRVDEYVRRWRGRWDWVEPPLLDALSLACGLRPDEDDRPPDPGKVEEALDALSKVWGAESEDGFVAGLLPRLETLATLLRTRDMLSDGMFGVHELWEALRALNELDEEAGPATAEREFERLMEEFLPALVDRERAEEMAWALLFLLRGEEWTASELESIILGLHFCLEEKAVFNPLWETVFRVCIYEAAAALNDMQQLTEEGKTLDVEAVEDFLDRHPIMEREWSRVVRERTSRAVIAILKGAIPLDVPPYAVAGALLGIAAHIRDLAEV
ncbi:MAG: SEC-C metal-binding domain-containing protein [Thermoanaerobacterales bacterium]|nr:SEC-C metal-binding domain-containing protein [Thermoanaerobacterales bacterium]